MDLMVLRKALLKRSFAIQMLRIMKLISFLLLAFCIQVNAIGYSQTVTLTLKNAPLTTVFTAIKNQTGYNFVYTNEDLQKANNVDIEVNHSSIDEVLRICFMNQPLTYTIVEKMVVIKQKEISSSTIAGVPPAEIRGRITNVQGIPLVSANVVIKRTGKGTQTNVNGEFVLKTVDPDDLITISYTGYKPQTIKIGSNPKLTLIMEIATNELDKVIVQAYGTTSQRLTTSNIGKVTAAEIEKQPVSNPLLALQGRVAGLQVTQTNGFASAPIKVELRGRNAIGNFPSDPLYIIDGVPLTVLDVGGDANYSRGSTGFLQTGGGFNGPANGQSPLFSVNPKDIESIEVLKDADATAIYGSRGANGVIIITTKKGRAGRTKLDISVTQGVQKVTSNLNVLNTQQYLEVRREAFKNDLPDGITPDEGNAYDMLVWDTTRYTNWQKALWGATGKNTDIVAGLTGGDTRTSFRIGAGYNRTTMITTANGSDQKASLSFSVTHHSINQKLSISFSNIYSYSQSDMINLTGSVMYAPNAPSIYDSSGNLNYAGWAPIRDQYPFASLKQPYTSKTNFLNSNLSINYTILKGLNVGASLGYGNTQANQQALTPIASQDPNNNPTGSSQFGNNSNKILNIEPQITYDALLGKGKINVLVGTQYEEINTDGLSVIGYGYINDALLRTVTNAPYKYATDSYGKYRYAAGFARLTYNWEDKYIINVTGRRDGSSRFGPGNQFGSFGSVGAAWIFTETNWFKKNIKWLSYGKIRGSYGTSGGDAGGDYKYLTRWSSNNTQIYSGIQPLVPLQHYNPDYHWSVNKKLEGAVELGFFKDKINLSIAYYRNRCNNQLLEYPTPAYTGFFSVISNWDALVQNSGWEVTAYGKIIESKNFNWGINFNVNINRNKLVSYPNFDQSPYVGIYEVGKPLNIVKLLHYTGVDPQTGLYTFQDKNKDGNISTTYGPDDDRFDYDLSAKFLGGLGMNFGYKNLQLNLFFSFTKQIGANVYNQGNSPGVILNQPVEVLDNRWQKPGDIAQTAKFTTQPYSDSYNNFKINSDAGFTDASFIRLTNLSLSYSLPNNFIKKAGIQGCSLFVNTQNIFVITKYKGVDPETQNFGGLPPPKTIVGGISFNF